ncbi:hypothetical protein [Aeoliella mucimassa]|uniref:Uncharacterized protein n=1 Tax=Aeoliella mucimassa TaxID=2527972 RepID=A0A518ARY7_9BACT|nr:hypothetical protein [Aeoliella mucimassa]QDU57482.1 hypothetical protein Pan181_36990 [Aeoliella mucimassa]
MQATRRLPLVLMLLFLVANVGCVTMEQRLSGYTCDRPAKVIDPRGVPIEPCCHCEPMAPRCRDTNACWQLQRTRETFFDSLYALIWECNVWPNSDCCQKCN